MKEAGGIDPIEKAIRYQDIHLFATTIGINTSSSLDKCAGKKLCGDDMWDQSKNSRTRRHRNKEAMHVWAGQTWQKSTPSLRE
jgi:hypothetical protein